MDTPEHTPELFTPEEREQAVTAFYNEWNIAAYFFSKQRNWYWKLRDSGWTDEDFEAMGGLVACKVAMTFDKSRGAQFATVVIASILNYANNETKKIAKCVKSVPFSVFQPNEDLQPNLCVDKPQTLEDEDKEHADHEAMRYLNILSNRQRRVVKLRLGIEGSGPMRWHQVARRMGICTERARQIYNESIQKIRKEIERES